MEEPICGQAPPDKLIDKWGLSKVRDQIKACFQYLGNNKWGELLQRQETGKETQYYFNTIDNLKQEGNYPNIQNYRFKSLDDHTSENPLSAEKKEQKQKDQYATDLIVSFKDHFSKNCKHWWEDKKQSCVEIFDSLNEKINEHGYVAAAILGPVGLYHNELQQMADKAIERGKTFFHEYNQANPQRKQEIRKELREDALLYCLPVFSQKAHDLVKNVAVDVKNKYVEFQNSDGKAQGKMLADLSESALDFIVLSVISKGINFTQTQKFVRQISKKGAKIVTASSEVIEKKFFESIENQVFKQFELELESTGVKAPNKKIHRTRAEKILAERSAIPKEVKVKELRMKAYLRKGQQDKHIVGTNNYNPHKKKSIVTLSNEKLEELTKSKIGMGIGVDGVFGEAGYKEIVEYDRIIGMSQSNPSGELTPTRFGKIHYKKDGGYHVVPYAGPLSK